MIAPLHWPRITLVVLVVVATMRISCQLRSNHQVGNLAIWLRLGVEEARSWMWICAGHPSRRIHSTKVNKPSIQWLEKDRSTLRLTWMRFNLVTSSHPIKVKRLMGMTRAVTTMNFKGENWPESGLKTRLPPRSKNTQRVESTKSLLWSAKVSDLQLQTN